MCFTTSFFTAEWPTHVTSGNEWIVDDSTLSHPPKKGSIDCIKKLFDPTAKKEHSPVHPIESYLAGHLKVCVCKSVLCSVTIVPEPSFLVVTRANCPLVAMFSPASVQLLKLGICVCICL